MNRLVMMGAALGAMALGGGSYPAPLRKRERSIFTPAKEKYPGQRTAYLKGASRGGAEGKTLPYIPSK